MRMTSSAEIIIFLDVVFSSLMNFLYSNFLDSCRFAIGGKKCMWHLIFRDGNVRCFLCNSWFCSLRLWEFCLLPRVLGRTGCIDRLLRIRSLSVSKFRRRWRWIRFRVTLLDLELLVVQAYPLACLGPSAEYLPTLPLISHLLRFLYILRKKNRGGCWEIIPFRLRNYECLIVKFSMFRRFGAS